MIEMIRVKWNYVMEIKFNALNNVANIELGNSWSIWNSFLMLFEWSDSQSNYEEPKKEVNGHFVLKSEYLSKLKNN